MTQRGHRWPLLITRSGGNSPRPASRPLGAVTLGLRRAGQLGALARVSWAPRERDCRPGTGPASIAWGQQAAAEEKQCPGSTSR